MNDDTDNAMVCDVAVIGAGTAGLVAERHAREAGAKTLLIDPEFAGTTCATVGCMPSKLLIAAADAAHGVRHADGFGIKARATVDGAAVMARLRGQRDAFVAAVRRQIDDLPATVRVRARAAFEDPTTLRLDDGRRIRAGAVVIATGSSPAVPDAFAGLGTLLLTNETLFDMDDLPASVGVVGAGPVGLELAQALSRLGVAVTVVDGGDRLAGLPDPAVSQRLHDILAEEFPVHLGVQASAERAGDRVRLTWSGDSSGEIEVARLLLAAGRPANLDGLNLGGAGLPVDDRGAPRFDPDTLQIGDAPVFIAGDANDAAPLLHEAAAEGAVAGRNAANWPTAERRRSMVAMSIVFTRPTAAYVGTIPDGDDAICGAAGYEDQGRAKVEMRNNGCVRLFGDRDTGRLTGAAFCLPDGEHLAHLLAWAIESENRVSDLLAMPFYHPTLEEGLKPALRDLCRRLDQPTAWDREDGFVPGV